MVRSPAAAIVPAAHTPNGSRSRCDHSRKASSMTSQHASYSAASAARTAYPGGSGRCGMAAPSGTSSTQLDHRT